MFGPELGIVGNSAYSAFGIGMSVLRLPFSPLFFSFHDRQTS